MSKYLSVISKQSFFSLFKFGLIPVFRHELISYSLNDGDVEDKLIKQLMNYPPPEFDEDYLIIVWNKEIAEKENSVVFNFKEAEEIIPLNSRAKISLTRKTAGKINFSEPRFQNVYSKLELQNFEKNCLKGSEVLSELVGLYSNYNILNDAKILRHAVELRLNGVQSYDVQEEKFVTHLILYEGFEKFPRYCGLGFIFDVIKVLADWKGITNKVGEKAYTEIKTFQLLKTNRDKLESLNSIGLLNAINDSKEEVIIKFKEALTQNNIRLWVVGYFFLYFKDKIRESNSLNDTTFISEAKRIVDNQSFIKELGYAISLVGYFFGFSKFYDDYYKFLNLKTIAGYKPGNNKIVKPVEKPLGTDSMNISVFKGDISQKANAVAESNALPKSDDNGKFNDDNLGSLKEERIDEYVNLKQLDIFNNFPEQVFKKWPQKPIQWPLKFVKSEHKVPVKNVESGYSIGSMVDLDPTLLKVTTNLTSKSDESSTSINKEDKAQSEIEDKDTASNEKKLAKEKANEVEKFDSPLEDKNG